MSTSNSNNGNNITPTNRITRHEAHADRGLFPRMKVSMVNAPDLDADIGEDADLWMIRKTSTTSTSIAMLGYVRTMREAYNLAKSAGGLAGGTFKLCNSKGDVLAKFSIKPRPTIEQVIESDSDPVAA